eukprot:TRINITY_DN34131_c0_g1_i1.p1 TRINITY_DN34131_c0_g1~~TRINITY_DN34131_c0_g1_i1.p1  ORF type:complete len:394 (-),score=60.20 TRINITY_DN34131_c0_g1_i1:48-1142(-)
MRDHAGRPRRFSARLALVLALATLVVIRPPLADAATETNPNSWTQREAAGLKPVGFRNPYYQSLGYRGSRVLEWNQTLSYAQYVEVTWSQAVTVDLVSQRTWIVDSVYHQVLMVEPETRYIKWPAYFVEYAGTRGMAGHTDGSRMEAKFSSPMGIAVASAGNDAVIFIADTNNHCLRRLDFATGRSMTIAGYAGRPGLRDGYGLETRFRFPTSLGVDSTSTHLFVLDNGHRIRHVDVSESPNAVNTLVGGSCRAIAFVTLPPMFQTVVLRTVACHPDWHAIDAGETDIEVAVKPVICIGHAVTCGPRDHPALSDRKSEFLTLPDEELLKGGPKRNPGQEADMETMLGAEGQQALRRRLFATNVA